jgi:hypothetical protein
VLLLLVGGGAEAQQAPAPADTVPNDTLPAGRAGPPPDPAADSVFQALRQLPGFTITEYQGESAVYRADEGVLRLQGSAEVQREGDRLTADTIVYRDRVELVEAYGQPRVSGQAQELEGNVLFYDLARRRATALGARTTVVEGGANWIVRGDVTLEGTDRVFATHGVFTTCDLAIPHYHFESDRIMVIRDRILVARPARLYFGQVPVMVLPFVVQNLERGRRSGLLTPRFGVNDVVRTSSGYNRQISDIGWYWAINDYMGAQVSGTWRSGAYTAMLGNLDYNWRRQFLQGNATFQQFWREGGGRELNLNGNTRWQPDERTNLGATGSYASSSDFLRDITFDPREQTQNLTSTFSLNRRFDWGSASMGAERRQSVSDGSVSGTLPRLSISPSPITFFRAPTPEQARWFSNMTLNLNASGDRSFETGRADVLRGLQDRQQTNVQMGQSLSMGNLSLSTSGVLNQTVLQRVVGADSALEARNQDRGNWSASASYRQELVGTTSISPTISFNQEFVRDTLTAGAYVGAPTRMNFGAGLNTDLYGFFPGVGGFTAIRHRLSPRLSYRYAPTVEQTDLQRRVFGPAGGRAQNVVSLGLNQTWEAKLRTPTEPRPEESVSPDTLTEDSARIARPQAMPAEPDKVTLLRIDSSPLEYDFIRAAEEGNGFLTERFSNTIASDYLRGLTIRMEHELFDRSGLDPDLEASRGQLGRFAPRLSSLGTSFELGPGSSIFRWLGFGRGGENPATQGAFPGTPQTPERQGAGAFTGNPMAAGGGPWRMSLQYQYSRAPRTFTLAGLGGLDGFGRPLDEVVQTVGANMSFPLSPGWGVNWSTDFSITDGRFGAHRLNFRRDLHRWQANFDFYQSPNGNSSFEFYVELLDNRDLKFDYRERNLGIDRR